MVTTLPRLVIAAPTSGSGKTTITTGLIAALTNHGVTVSPHKVGPDYIDPGWHGAAAGRPGRNVDPILQGPEAVPGLLLYGANTPEPADVAIIEGVMGLFDGAIGQSGAGSTAHVAELTHSPIVLVVDASRTARSVAALIHGFVTFEPGLRFAGVIVNNVGSPRHAREVRAAVAATGLPLLGLIPRTASVQVGSRHLGLVTAAEWQGAQETIAAMADLVEQHCDLNAILASAHQAPELSADPWQPPTNAAQAAAQQPVVAVFGGQAFTFSYPEHTELLTAAGAQVITVDPLRDTALPPGTAGLVIGGGFPEVHAQALSDNVSLRTDIATQAADGLSILAECAGLTYLCESLDAAPMCGVLPAHAEMSKKLTIGYRQAVAVSDNPLMTTGHRVVGHEFHRTKVQPSSGKDCAGFHAAWGLTVDSGEHHLEGFAATHVLASYLHQHWAGTPEVARTFLASIT